MRSQQTSRMNHRQAETVGCDSLLYLFELLQLEVCFLGLSSASCAGLSCVTTCQHHWNRSFRFTVVFLVFAFLLAFLFVALVTLFLSSLSLARCPSVLTCQGSCAAQGRRRFSVPVSTLARAHAKFGTTHDLRRGTTLRRSRSAAGACASMVAT